MQVAAIQMVSTPDTQQNMATAKRLLTQAAQQGANLCVLPEYWSIMGMHDTDKIKQAEVVGQGEVQDFLSAIAKKLAITLVAGTIPITSNTPDKIMNTCLVYSPQGERISRYDKMHLFGFTNADSQESYQESNTIQAGNQVVCFESDIGKIGLGICYDLRFPEFFRSMGQCTLIILPAAFTYTTGQAHWEILLRARAIENQCYVLASAQGGKHQNGRRTWGQSMLINPWGEIVSQLAEGEGIVSGDINLEAMAQIRRNLPALQHIKIRTSSSDK